MRDKSVIMMVTLLFISSSSVRAQDVDIEMSIKPVEGEYCVGERIIFKLTLENISDDHVSLEIGRLDFGLHGVLMIYDAMGKQLVPYFTIEGTQTIEMSPHDRREYYVPINLYGKRRPYSMTATPDPGIYSWNYNLVYYSNAIPGYGRIKESGKLKISKWSKEDNAIIDMISEINSSLGPSEERYGALEELSRSTRSRRIEILLLDMLRYNAKMLQKMAAYINTMKRLERIEDCAVCRYLIQYEGKSLKIGRNVRADYDR